MLVTGSIPNLINGISQQPSALRLPTQGEIQTNLYSSVVEGLMDRPPTEHLAKLYNGTIGDAYAHVINRDTTERYMVLIRDGDLTVHDISGTQKTVNFPNGKTYLNGSTPSTKIKAVTIADHTFILNLTKTPAMKPGLTTVRAKEALVFVKAGNYSSNYKVFIDGVEKATKTTSDTAISDIRTEAIAEDLRGDLVTNLGAGWTISRYGSVVSVVKDSGDFKIKVEDSQGGASLQAFKDKTQNFTSLPTVAPTDFQIEITGSPESGFDNYHVKFTPATAGETFGEGTWEETVGMGIKHQIDETTMPHLLVRESNGEFTFKVATWISRTVGDLVTIPEPSFIGQPINAVFLFKNRLCLLAADNVICSQVGGYFNFWPTTATTVVDNDPIDYTVVHSKAAILRHALPFDEKAVLFSDQTQFIMQGGQTFTAKTITVDPSTEVENLIDANPVASGNNIYFATPGGSFNGLREYIVDRTTSVKDAINVTGHVPKYVPAGAVRVMASSTESLIAVLTTGKTNTLYLYKYFFAADEKLQSSWSDSVLGDANTKILGGDFIAAVAYLAIQRSDGVYLEKADFSPGRTDPSVNFVTHLDRRITEAQCSSVVYNGGLNKTTWTLPYAKDGIMVVVTRTTNPGQLIPLTLQSGTTLEAEGDHTAKTVYIGQEYERHYRFSHFHAREDSKEGSRVVLDGRLQIGYLTIAFADTGTFTVTVTPDHRNASSYTEYRDPTDSKFTSKVLGSGSSLVGAVALATGKKRVPILSQNNKVTVDVKTTSFLPMRLLSAEWNGELTLTGRRGR